MLFRADGGDIINLKTKRKTPFGRHGNVYVLDAWVENPQHKQPAKDDKTPSAEVLCCARPGGRTLRSAPIL